MMDDAEYKALRLTAFAKAQPTVAAVDIDKARADKRMALSLRVSVDVFDAEIRHAVVKIVFPDKSEQTVLFDPVAAQALSEQLAHVLSLGWRTDALRPKGPAH
jgi:hypothetical protein